jgi:hypothetical protein
MASLREALPALRLASLKQLYPFRRGADFAHLVEALR